MITMGKSYALEVVKAVDFGFYLDAGELDTILLPLKSAPDNLKVGDTVQAFLYFDSQNRPVATTRQPKASVGEFAFLPVVATTRVGAFLDWGLERDILVPFAEQNKPMEVGHYYLVYIYLDDVHGRLTASPKIDNFLDNSKPHTFKPRQKVDLIIANQTDLGYKAIINHSHWGVLYRNEVFRRLSFGESVQGYIKTVRPDGKIDLALQDSQESRDLNALNIRRYLEANGGFAPVHDKSDASLIAELFGISKSEFKKTIGGLYKQRIINLEKDGIRLLEKQETD